MATQADEQLHAAQGASGFGRVLSGILRATKLQNRGHVGAANTLCFHPQLRRWVEPGIEDASSTTTDLPPPPMSHAFQPRAPSRQPVSQRYKLQENLRVSPTCRIADGVSLKGLPLEPPFLPVVPSNCGANFLIPPLHHPDDDQHSTSGPSSADCSSGCSSASGSGSPLTRSSSEGVLSLANGVRAALSDSNSTSSSVSSSRAGSACGSTDDTASSPGTDDDVDLHEFTTLKSPFTRLSIVETACQARRIPPPPLLQSLSSPSAQLSGRSKWSCEHVGSVSTLCTVDSSLLVATASQERSEAPIEELAAAAFGDGVDALAKPWPHEHCVSSGAVAEALSDGEPNDAFSCCCGGDFCSREGGATLSRSSSLALSLADLVHHDSLNEVELLLREPSPPPTTTILHQQQGRGHTAVASCDAADDSFAFTPVPSANSPDTPQLQRQQPKLQQQGAGDLGALVGDPFSFPTVFASGGLRCDSAAIVDAAIVGAEEAAPGPQQQWQHYAPDEGQRHEEHAQVDAPVPGCGSGASTREPGRVQPPVLPGDCTTSAAATVPRAAGRPGAVNLTAVESTVELLKQLRGSLLKSGSLTATTQPVLVNPKAGSGVGLGSGTVSFAAGGPVSPTRSPSAVCASPAAALAHAAQQLAGLGLLPAPLGNSGAGSACSRPAISAVKPSCGLSSVDTAATATALPQVAKPSSQPLDSSLSAQSVTALEDVGCYLGASGVWKKGNSSASVGVQTQPAELCGSEPASLPRCRAVLQHMQADWVRVREQVGGIMGAYSALAKQVAATVVKQVVVERRCAAVEGAKAALLRQLAQERQQRQELLQQVQLERQQRQALEQQLLQERQQREELVRLQLQAECGLVSFRETEVDPVSQAEEEVAGLRLELDELLLCLGQESTKVAALAAALRAAGGEPAALIEQVEDEFAAKEVGCV